MKPITYEERYCVFIDILGFSSLIKDSATLEGQNNKKLSQIISSLTKIREMTHYIEKGIIDDGADGTLYLTSRKFIQFSDSIVISYLKTDLHSAFIFHELLRIQLSLIHDGILFRGAVTCGELYHDDHLVLGPAFVEAVELEKLASYPRMIVHRELAENGVFVQSEKELSSGRVANNTLRKDFDGVYYVDYFNVVPEDFGENWSTMIEYLNKLRDKNKELSDEKDLSIELKYSWLRQKFNDMVENAFDKDRLNIHGHLIPKNHLSSFKNINIFQ